MADLFLIPYLRSVWRMLRYRLGPDARICIFGAGAHTRWLLSVTKGIPGPTIECIVDDDPVAEELSGIAVRRPSNAPLASAALILISSDRWEAELAARARELWGNRLEILRLYEGLPRGPYDKGDDHAEALSAAATLSPLRLPEDRQVVIVSDRPRSREAKIGYALLHAGWRPVLLFRHSPTFDVSYSFDRAIPFNNEWEALRMACDYSPVVYHIMVNSDYRVAELFLRHRIGTIVVDSYDIIAGMYTDEFLTAHPDFAEEIPRERYCLENADGLCCRSRETDVLVEQLGYRLRQRLPFPDGCWNVIDCTGKTRDAELHIAYAGVVDGPLDERRRFASCGCNLSLARGIVEQHLHLHVFPSLAQASGDCTETLNHFRSLERESSYFHLYEPVCADVLVHAMTQYDLAISPYPELIISTGAPIGLTGDKLRCCTSNKYYDYIDARLPIIHNAGPGSLLSNLVDEYGIGINVDGWQLQEWPQRLRKIDLTELEERLARARSAYDIRRSVWRLTEFYHRVQADSSTNTARAGTHAEERNHAADNRSAHRQALV